MRPTAEELNVAADFLEDGGFQEVAAYLRAGCPVTYQQRAVFGDSPSIEVTVSDLTIDSPTLLEIVDGEFEERFYIQIDGVADKKPA